MSPIERYQKLGYSESLPRIHRYPSACKELSFILRRGYSNFPKNLQALIFQDVLAAFRLLSGMQTSSGVSAAHILVQSAEAALPKQKRNMAVTEFKQAMVAHKRRLKARQEEKVSGSSQLPQDVLVQIFGLLDLRSLVSVALVNWSWNLAASDDRLWHVQYITFFGSSDYTSKAMARKEKDRGSLQEEIATGASLDWKEAFKKAYKGGKSLKNLASSRGFCGNCRRIVWLDNTKCSNEDCRLHFKNQQVKPVSPSQVVEYILDGSVSMTSSSDSESDSEEVSRPMSKYWAFPVLE